MTPCPSSALWSRRAWLVAAAGSAAGLAACGGGATEPPELLAFDADRLRYAAGERARLTLRYRGARARLEPGLGEVASGATVTTPPLAATTTLRLVVESPGHVPLERALTLRVGFDDRWRVLGGFTVTGHATASAEDGSLWLFGGSRGESVLSRAIERFDAAAGRFVRVGEMAAGRSGHRVVRLADGRFLVAGGVTSENVAPFAELVDPATGRAEAAGAMNGPRAWHALVALADGRALALGGWSRDDAELWSPATRTWQPVASRMARERQYPSATRLPDGRVLVAGGGVGFDAEAPFAEIFDPATGRFGVLPREAAPPSMRRMLHAAFAAADGSVWLAGGEDDRSGLLRDDVLRFDPATGRFTGAGTLPRGRTVVAGCRLPDGELLLVGGGIEGAAASTGGDAWRPATPGGPARGRALAPMPGSPRLWHTVDRLADGRLLVVGGDDGDGRFASDLLIYE